MRLAYRLKQFARYLRGKRSDAITNAPKDGTMNPHMQQQHDTVVAATAKMTSSAEHLAEISRRVAESHPRKPVDSFEEEMRRLLGRLD